MKNPVVSTNNRAGVDAGWRALFASQSGRAGTTQRERWALHHPLARLLCYALFITVSLALPSCAYGQDFANLDFEAANVSGYPLTSSYLPISRGLPGWTSYYVATGERTNFIAQMGYDWIPTPGISAISIMDSNAASLKPLQGQYSACLFGLSSGAPGFPGNTSLAISQTGRVPDGARSILMEVSSLCGFEVMLNGQEVDMAPLETFSNYTLYGGDVSSFTGQLATLSLLSPPTITPNIVEIDSITFSPAAAPEPGTAAMLGICIPFLWWRAMRANKIIGANAGRACRLRIRASRAARIAQFWRWTPV